jgi:uncharacterized protein (DUF1778 family)
MTTKNNKKEGVSNGRKGRYQTVTFRCTRDEKLIVRNAANGAGKSVNEFVRDFVLGGLPQQ